MKTTRNITQLLTITATASSLLLAPSLTEAETDFLKVLPQESVAAVWTGSLSQLQTNAEQSPYGKLWADPALDPLRNFIKEKIQEDQPESIEAFTEIEKFFDVMKDGMAVSFSMDPNEPDPEEAFHFNLVAELNEQSTTWTKEKVAELEKAFTTVTKDTYEVSGVTVYRLKGEIGHSDAQGETPTQETIQYTWVDKYFILSDSENDVKKTVGAIKATSTVQTLSGLESIKLYNQKVPFQNDTLNFFINSGDLIKTAIETSEDIDPTIKSKLPRTGLYDLQAVIGSSDLQPEGIDFSFAVITPQEKRGAVKMLKDMGPVDLSVLSMAPANALSASAFSFSIGDLYDEIIKQITMFNPQAASYMQMGVMAAQTQLGVDAINGILKNIEGNHVFVERAFTDEVKQSIPQELAVTQNSMLAYMALSDGAETATNIQTMFEFLKKNPDMGGSIDLSEINGVKVAKFPSAMTQTGALVPCLAWNSKYAVFTNNETELQDAVRALTTGTTTSITTDEGFAQALNTVEKQNLHSFTYTPASAMEAGMKQLQTIAKMGMLEEMLGVKADIIPDPAVFPKYLGNSWSTMNFDDRMLILQGHVEKAK